MIGSRAGNLVADSLGEGCRPATLFQAFKVVRANLLRSVFSNLSVLVCVCIFLFSA